MDLDFSFALVSSLTPRGKAEKAPLTENFKKNKSLKTKQNQPSTVQSTKEFSHKKIEEKENHLPEDQLMNKHESIKPVKNKRNSNLSSNISSDDRVSHSFVVNMDNIAVRRTRTRGRRKVETIPLNQYNNGSGGSDEYSIGTSSKSNEVKVLCVAEVINISTEHDDGSNKSHLIEDDEDVKRKSTQLSRVSDTSIRSSLEIIESSCSDVKCESNVEDDKLNINHQIVKTNSTRASALSETSLSTAYDSDSFQAVRRHGVKVIPETPDTDRSSSQVSDKRKSSVLSFTSEENKQRNSIDRLSNEISKRYLRVERKSSACDANSDQNSHRHSLCNSNEIPCNLREKRKSSALSFTSEENKLRDNFSCSIIDSDHEENKQKTSDNVCIDRRLAHDKHSKLYSSNEIEIKPKKKLRSSNESTVTDVFRLESTIKDHTSSTSKSKEADRKKFDPVSNQSIKDKRKSSISPVLKEINTKEIGDKKFIKKKKSKVNIQTDDENISKQKLIDNSKNTVQRTNSTCRKGSSLSPKTSTLVLPSEVIPKFEHINRWLEDTQEKTLSSLENDSSKHNVVSKKGKMPAKSKYKVSLSPRIKKRKDKAKNSLEEEQKLFEELYGAGIEKRLSDDVDEVASRTSCQDSVEFSENVLDKLYGTVWQKNTQVTQSEPRKGKKNSSKKTTPHSERKIQRTSIYEVFSSSSSEDRFEEFLENVQRGKIKPTKRRSGRPSTPDFIHDSESEDDTDLVFYQNIVSSAVKEEVNNLKSKGVKKRDSRKVNRRRLSFTSSKDDCSESGNSDIKSSIKSKKPSKTNPKTQIKKSRSKKDKEKDIDGNPTDEIEVFSLVTPLKIKDKKTENDLSERKTKPLEVPRSVGKSKTPKNPIKTKDLVNTEEKLRATYLRDGDFKVPKTASNLFKTPSKNIKADVPSSPALSFLSSLSEMTAGLPCHPDALVYKKNFKSKREELTKKLFVLYNREIFENQLPAEMLIQWSTRMTSTSGYCYNKRIYRDNQVLRSSRIVLSTKILDRADRLRDTLIHELCHAATWIVHATSDGHGPIWRSWADKANRRFPELPVIKRCHDYAITTKFTYKCMSCGYCIGRHTKSLDTERKRCGFCLGKFQVFVTAKMSTASATSGSDSVRTPRNPTGFALFVKQNYALVKKENNVPHAQVMKLLSQKFAEVKISKQTIDEPILVE